MRAAMIVCVLSAATIAHAQAPASPLRQGAVTWDQLDVRPAETHVTWRMGAVAASSAARTRDTREVDGIGSVGAEVAVSGPACDFVIAGGQLDVAARPLSRSAQQWASVCLVSGKVELVFDHRLEWDVEPSLIAPPRLLPRGNRRETVGVTFGVRLDEGTADGVRRSTELAAWRSTVSIGWGQDDLSSSVAAEVAFYRAVWDRGDGSPRSLALGVAGVEAGSPPTSVDPTGRFAMAGRVDVVRAEGWRLAGLRWGAGLGVVQAATVAASETAMDPRSASALAGRVDLSAEREVGAATVRAHAGRSAWTAYDGRAVIDDRVALSARGAAGAWRGDLQVSAARDLILDPDGPATVLVGGAALTLSRSLGDHLDARAELQAARSVYAPGATFTAPGWAAEARLSLALHAGSR
jgi:hypothetical protein